MTEDRMLTDREKLEVWDKICQDNQWAAPNEIDRWLHKHGIYFTGGGSCINMGPYAFRVENIDNAKVVVNGTSIDELVTFIIEVFCGVLMFISVEVEEAFWKLTYKRLKEEFKVDLPRELVPKYLRESVYSNSGKNEEDPGVSPNFDNPSEE